MIPTYVVLGVVLVFLGIGILAIIVEFVGPAAYDTVAAIFGSAESDQATQTAPEPGPTPTPKPISWTAVTANEILTTYESNEIAGHRQFADKPLEVTGTIKPPDYAPFSSEKRYRIRLVPDKRISLETLHCELPIYYKTTAWVTALAGGDTVTVRGYIRDNMELGILELEKCVPIAP